MILYRPVGLQELALIYDSDMKAFPARLPQQPIFYPVLQLEYARQTASDWNAKNGQFAGYITQFKVEDEYIEKFEEHAVGGSQYQELWIPAEEVEEFNKHITGPIKVLEGHFGDASKDLSLKPLVCRERMPSHNSPCLPTPLFTNVWTFTWKSGAITKQYS